ncbi:cuticle protein AM1239-like isoform X1 [Panulirus ornatus]|uniref:cuticle protein AM1239-like isoform X1 n=1 Tax=Panulirus ornatus TaxID=150431 RepID=UPI003A85A75C
MKLAILLCLVAVAAAAPQNPDHLAETVVDERVDQGDGNFNYRFETTNGINEERVGTPGSNGQSNFRGSFSYILPDGNQVVVTYVADENGHNAESPYIPTAPPPPPHALELIALTDKLRSEGVTWDEQGFVISG